MDLSRREAETLSIHQQKSSTLPDLGDHLPVTEIVHRPADSQELTPEPHAAEVESGAHTIVFADSDSAQLGQPVEEQPPAALDFDKSSAPAKATSLLPGVSGSQFEQAAQTSVLNQTRTTAPVEDDSPDEAELSDSPDESNAAHPSMVTRVAFEGPSADSDEEQVIPQGTTVLGSDADLRDTGSQLSGHRTVIFGSDLAENENELATPQWNSEGPTVRQEIMTAPFGIVPPGVDMEEAGATRIMQPEAQDLNAVAAQETSLPDRSVETSYRTNKEVPVATIDNQAAIVAHASEKKKSSAVLIAIAALVVLAIAASAVWYVMSGSERPARPTEEPPVADSPTATTPAPPAVPPPAIEKPAVPAAPEGMALVAGGQYIIGRDDADPVERPRRAVSLPPFFIDLTEVTNAAYKKFVDETGHKLPPNWKDGTYPEGKGDYPVTSVTWQDAMDYAAWAGKRLPTETEWEAAARGTEGRIYPWGDKWEPALSNINLKRKDLKPTQYAHDIKPVGQFPQGASASGALDMIGNVWEWTADKFALYPGGITQVPEDIVSRIKEGKDYRIIRGGAFDGSEIHDGSYRGLLDASQPYPKVGFRCVKDSKQ
jgi:formylglycine-generating enzyme required for sulfatase activity